MEQIKIKVKSFDAKLVDSTAKKIFEFAKEKKAEVSGPIPLPTKRELFTILRSVHVNKKSREQFEQRTHKRLIIISKVDSKTIDGLKRFDLPSGVMVEVKDIKK